MSDVGKITIIAKNIKGNANGQVRYDAKKISNTSAVFLRKMVKGTVFHMEIQKKGKLK